jgi:hypothetical protein
MVVHIFGITRNSHFSEILRPAAFGPAIVKTFLVLLLLFPLFNTAAQSWQLRASLVELPDGVLVDPTNPAGTAYRGFTGLNLLTGDLALLIHPRGEVSAFYRIESLDGGGERFYFQLSDGRTVELVRVPAAPGRYHFLYRLDPDFFAPPGESEKDISETDSGIIAPEPAGSAPAGNAGGKTVPGEPSDEAMDIVVSDRILYVGTMAEGTR